MRSDHLNKHLKTHNPQTNKKVKEEKIKQNGQQATNPQQTKQVKVKQEKSELSPRMTIEEQMMYNNSLQNSVDYQTNVQQTVQTANNEQLFAIQNSHSFAPMLDRIDSAGNMVSGFAMPFYS